jgi:DNA repair protein RadC
METTLMELHHIAEIQLSYKSAVKPSLRPKILSSKSAYDLLVSTWDSSKLDFVEQFKVLLLNRANKVIGMFEVSSGGCSGTVVDSKIILVSAIKANACGVILAHNHPSGNLSPSQADIEITSKINNAGKFLDVKVLDHLIVTTEGYYSFADEGLL